MTDSERIDFIERTIRDGSYASILNDVIAVCQHAYRTFGHGPAFRTALDAVMPTPNDRGTSPATGEAK